MRAAFRTGLALAAAFGASTATAQITPVPRINEKGPDKIVSPTPTPGLRVLEPGALGPKELPPTRTPAPTRTPTATPAPPAQRFAGPRWGADQYLLPIAVTRLDAHSQCKTTSDFFNSGMFFVSIDCYAQGRGPLGLKADADVAKGLRLKNGWKVKSVEINFWDGTQPVPPDATHGFRITKKPDVGSDDPSVSLHLFSDGFKGIVVRGGVLIEGPHGTTPW